MYELGALKLIGATGTRFLTFRDTTGNVSTNFFQSAQLLAYPSTMVGFSRFATFDDSNYLGTRSTPDTATLWAVDSAQKYHDDHRAPVVGTAYFGGSSRVCYILELRETSLDTTVMVLDSLECYRSSTGALRFVNHPNTLNFRDSVALSQVNINGQVVRLAVRVVANLLPGSGFVRHEYNEVAGNSSTPLVFSLRDQDLPAPKKAQFPRVVDIFSRLYNLTIEDTKAPVLKAHVSCTSGGPARLLLIEVASGKTSLQRDIDLKEGENVIDVQQSGIATGAYLLVIENGFSKCSVKLNNVN